MSSFSVVSKLVISSSLLMSPLLIFQHPDFSCFIGSCFFGAEGEVEFGSGKTAGDSSFFLTGMPFFRGLSPKAAWPPEKPGTVVNFWTRMNCLGLCYQGCHC